MIWLLAPAALGFGLPATAQALTVSVSATNHTISPPGGGTQDVSKLFVTVTGTAANENVTVSAFGTRIAAFDQSTNTWVTAQTGSNVVCQLVNMVNLCSADHTLAESTITINAGAGDDTASYDENGGGPILDLDINLGDGTDSSTAFVDDDGRAQFNKPADVLLHGGAGDDSLGAYNSGDGGGGSVVLHGDGDDDYVSADPNSILHGDDGDDTVEAQDKEEDDGTADTSGSATGGAGNDVFKTYNEGGSLALSVVGGTVVPLAGDQGTTLPDSTTGFEGLDGSSTGTVTLHGDDGPNDLTANDPGQLVGNGGNDRLTSRGGTVLGGGGADAVFAHNGAADDVDCGPDLDTEVFTDTTDTVSNCESGISLTGGPTGTVNATEATFSFAFQGSQSPGHFECKLDGGAFATCTAPHTVTGLLDGSHTFEVKFVPDAGQPTAPASRQWTVDATPPEATITMSPAATGNGSDVAIAWSGPPDVRGYLCSLDSAAPAPCTSPVSLVGLVPGSHTFAIVAIDGAGNEQPTPTVVTFAVGTPPAQQQTLACAAPALARVAFGPIVAVATSAASCFVTARIDGADVRIARGPVIVNGLALEPLDPGGGVIVDDRLQGGAVRMVGRVRMRIGSFETTLPSGTAFDGLGTGVTALLSRASSLFESNALAGLPLTGSVGIKFSKDLGGQTVFTFKVQLPNLSFQTLPYEAALTNSGSSISNALTLEVPLSVSNDQGVQGGLKVTVGEAWLGIVKVKDLTIGYDHSTGVLSGGVTMLFAASGVQGEKGIQFGIELGRDGIVGPLRKLSALATGLNVPLGSVAFLQRVGFELARLEGAAGLGLTGKVGVSLGPNLDLRFFRGEPVSLDGSFTLGVPNSGPVFLRGTGTGKIADFDVAEATLSVTSPAEVRLTGAVEIGIFGYGARMEIREAWVTREEFNVVARGVITLPGALSLLTHDSVDGVLSSRGYAVCIGDEGEQVGFGSGWGGDDPHWFDDTCDLAAYTTVAASASAAGARSFDVTRGTRVVSVLVPGAGAAPALTVSGPGGASFATGPGGVPVANRSAILVQDPRAKATRVVLFRPRRGRWTVTAQDGGALGALRIARPLPPVRIRAGIVGRGVRRTLTWRTTGLGSQRLRFTERAGGQARVLTTARSARGRKAFTPLTSRTREHTIEATILRGGLPRSTETVARLRTGPSRAPRRITGLRRKAARVSWKPVAGAVQYAIAIRLSDGTTIAATSRTARYSLPRALAKAKVTVAIRAIDALGRLSPTVREALKP